MKLLKVLLLVLILIPSINAYSACVPEAGDPPATSNLGLWKPADQSCNWGNRWNQNADTLDAIVPSKTSANTWTQEQTFNDSIDLSTSDGIIHGMLTGGSITIENLDPVADNTMEIAALPFDGTVVGFGCNCDPDNCEAGTGCCVDAVSFTLTDRLGNAMTHSNTCSTDESNTTIHAVTAGGAINEGEGIRLNMSGGDASDGDYYTIILKVKVN